MTKYVKHMGVGEELDSVEWQSEELHELPVDSVLLVSEPPVGFYRVLNIYYDQGEDEHVMTRVDTPV